MEFSGLPRAALSPLTDTAQRFLASAYDSVYTVLRTLEVIRTLRKNETGDVRGRLTAGEEDLLRAAVVFAGAGLDSTLKQLMRDCLSKLLDCSEGANQKFEQFAERRITAIDIADPKMVARYLTAPSPRDKLIEDYLYDLTGSSLQSANQVQRTVSALGITDAAVRKRIGGLQTVFVARNEISHELDLRRPERPGDRARRNRSMQPTANLCLEALTVAQLIINAAAALLHQGR